MHRITLYDHEGAVIDPEDEFAGPYSPRTTCAKCHDYAQISRGWHFNAWSPDVPAGRCGEPWLLVDPRTGTVLAISGRAWPGTFRPQDVGLTNWDFIMRFGRHLPGGGYGEPNSEPEAQARASLQSANEWSVAADPRVGRSIPRWHISGPLEIDCMFCHSADQQHDPAEAARQIEMENFKWAPTAALGLAVIRGEARKAPDDWDPLMPPDPDFPERAGPRLVWDRTRFDPDHRVLFNITRRPPNERCYFCHSFREVGPDAPDVIVASQDVHLAAGLLCVDCHRNGLDHMMTRGYRTEAAERGDPVLAAFSCEGCHLGVANAGGAEVELGGRYGALHPQHRGLPPVHFEKLTCTACHSGPWPEMYAKRFQTAMAHALGLATRERSDDDPPHIVAPIFARQHDGRIAPQRMVWALRGSDAAPAAGRAVSLYRWSIAHNVRPAAQSLGFSDCTDCHANDAPIYFGRIAAAGAANGNQPPLQRMCELRGDDATLERAWALGFVIRPAFRVFAFACAGVIVLLLVRYGLDGLVSLLRRIR